jgi:hypothetical protein
LYYSQTGDYPPNRTDGLQDTTNWQDGFRIALDPLVQAGIISKLPTPPPIPGITYSEYIYLKLTPVYLQNSTSYTNVCGDKLATGYVLFSVSEPRLNPYLPLHRLMEPGGTYVLNPPFLGYHSCLTE